MPESQQAARNSAAECLSPCELKILSIHELPTPTWILDRQLSGPTTLVTEIPAWQAQVLLGVFVVAFAALFAMDGIGASLIVAGVGIPVVFIGAWAISKYRLLAGSNWLAVEYVIGKRLVRLDCLDKVSVTIGSWTYLKLRDTEGGRVDIPVSYALPKIRTLVVDAVMGAAARGALRVDERTAQTLRLQG